MKLNPEELNRDITHFYYRRVVNNR